MIAELERLKCYGKLLHGMNIINVKNHDSLYISPSALEPAVPLGFEAHHLQ